jgi:prophage antirepressor-like protein/predicted transcriptional regulator
MDILPFTYENDHEIRAFKDKFQNIWFIAKDIAKLLKYERPSDAISQHCKNTLTQNEFQELHGEIPYSLDSRLKLIPESDVWRLIIKSKLPEAERIEEWIMEEVLPSIRKTGSYSLEKEEHELKKVDLNEIQETLKIGSEILETLNSKNVFEKIQLDNFLKSQNGISVLELLKINFENMFFLPTELGKFIGISAIEMNQNLREKGLQIKSENGWKLTEKGQKFGVDVSENFPQIKWKIEVLFL